MLHTLESPALRIAVSNKGAELQSIFCKKTNTEHLWQGGPGWWGGRAPVLFPVVCALKDGAFTHEGKRYELIKHGFVRNASFHDRHTPDKLIFEYIDSPETRAVYPFGFIFTVEFSLRDNQLIIDNRVVNQGKDDMYFSVGAHEAFNCPITDEISFEDYYLEFDTPEKPDNSLINMQSGLLSGETHPVPLQNDRILPLKHCLFDNDALIFKDIKSRKVSLKSRKSNTVIEVTYDAPHLGIWQMHRKHGKPPSGSNQPGAPYICIEPWWGLPDYDHSSGILAEKDGIVKLGAGKEFVFNHTITLS
jgi:galactose mutarotase-like enzyme